jgi:hypothetical protein
MRRDIWNIPSLLLVVAVCAALPLGGVRTAAGILAGGLWNLANLWCLNQLLGGWLGPSRDRRRALGWLVVKFPVLYTLAFLALARAVISPLAFGIGFTVVLFSVVIWLAMRGPHLASSGSHGR